MAARAKTITCWLFALTFALAGVLHFTETASFARIVPPLLPYPERIVQVTGAMELAFAVGLLIPRWRRVTGWALSLYLLAVLPANIYMAMERIPLGERVLSDTLLWLRVAFQFPLVALVIWATRDQK